MPATRNAILGSLPWKSRGCRNWDSPTATSAGWWKRATRSMRHEVTRSADPDRKFARGINTRFSPDTRFLLTDAGRALAGGNPSEPTLIRLTPQPGSMPPAPAVSGTPDAPKWNSNVGVLSFGARIVKRFPRAARNQEIILSAFEEEGWPPRIDDPLPPSRNVEPKRRLHDTIKWLNRDQEARVLAFLGDGTGEGVRWRSLVSGKLPVSGNSAAPLRSRGVRLEPSRSNDWPRGVTAIRLFFGCRQPAISKAAPPSQDSPF